jgi:CRISPR-associated protein Cas2
VAACVWVVTYDIADDGRGERVATLLSAYGPHVQLSVFECMLPTQAAEKNLRGAGRRAIDTDEDQVRMTSG